MTLIWIGILEVVRNAQILVCSEDRANKSCMQMDEKLSKGEEELMLPLRFSASINGPWLVPENLILSSQNHCLSLA